MSRAAAQGWRAATGVAVRDHRDVLAGLYRPSMWDYVSGAAADFPQQELDRVALALRRIDERELRRRRSAVVGRSVATVVLIALLAFISLVVVRNVAPPLASAWPVAMIAVALFVGMTVTATITNWRTGATKGRWDAAPEDVATAMLAVARCPACAQRLHGLPSEADGCTVCPECGAAWRLGGMAVDETRERNR